MSAFTYFTVDYYMHVQFQFIGYSEKHTLEEMKIIQTMKHTLTCIRILTCAICVCDRERARLYVCETELCEHTDVCAWTIVDGNNIFRMLCM